MKDVATEAEYDQTIAEINRLWRKGDRKPLARRGPTSRPAFDAGGELGRSSSSDPGSAGVSNPETLHASSGAQTDRLAADPRLARSHIGDSQRQALDHKGAGQTARRVFRRISRGFYLTS
jgi:hypothetical protein